ncbi:MAG: TolC family protein, partial [Phycisphaerae bacterium]
MIRRRGTIVLALVGVAALSGCANVNPRPDYERAATYVAEATGQDALYQPGDDQVVAEKVDALLDGGLTADEAVQAALLNNPRLQAAFMTVGMARADVVQSGLLSNPSLSVALRFPAGGGLANLEAGLAQDIAALWQIPARQRAAERSLDRHILELARQAAELAAETKRTYFRAVAAEEQHTLAEESLSVARNLLELAETRQQAGAGNQLDVNLSRTVVVEADLAVELTRLNAAAARRTLATLLGVSSQVLEAIALSPLPEAPAEIPDAETLIEAALRARLDIRAARQVVLAAKARVEEEYRRVFPTFELGVALERAERKRQGGRDV